MNGSSKELNNYYKINTFEEKTISEYTGLNFIEIDELIIVDYLIYFADAIIYKLQQSEEGRKILKESEIREQTEPDRKELRKTFGKGA